MGAGYVLDNGRVPHLEMAARVGGPLSALRAEAAGLLHLLSTFDNNQRVAILIFCDSLVLLHILHSWGNANFHPRPNDIVHST
jgi:hypothetical protein